ncbi:MAG: glucosyltransferase domain-containing protein [Elusimicrobiota bacterium]|jgi:hypothetical protein|nr:glucosyltransferase domain-containing protein [Elusimicrobiota bacterium]
MQKTFERVWELLNKNWADVFIKKVKKIPSVYVKSFIIIFSVAMIAFAFHTINFLPGDHVIHKGRLVYPIGVNHTINIGRFSLFYIMNLLTGGHLLPVLNNIYSLLGFSIGAIMLCIYWKIPKTVLYYSIIGTLLVIQPYTLLSFWYSFSAIGDLWLLLCVVSSFLLADNAFQTAKISQKIICESLSVILIVFVLGAYPPIVNTIAVVFLGRLIIDVFLEKEISFSFFYKTILKHKYSIISLAIGAVIFKLILEYLKIIGKLSVAAYSLQTISIENFPSHFMEVVNIAFSQLWNFPVAFFPIEWTRLFTIIFIFAIAIIILNILFDESYTQILNRPKMIKCAKILYIVFLAIAVIIFSKTAAIISGEEVASVRWDAHILSFGTPLLHVLPIALVCVQKIQLPKNLTIIVCIALINMCLIQDVLALKVWKYGYDAESNLWQRVVIRIENDPSFNRDKGYEYIFIGRVPSYRPNYYYKSKDVMHLNNILDRAYASVHSQATLTFFYPDLLAKSTFGSNFLSTLRRNDKKALEYAAKLKNEINNAQVWPSKNSVIVKDDAVIVVFNKTDLAKVKKIIQDYETLQKQEAPAIKTNGK